MAHPKTTAQLRPAEDPQLRLMLATHIHCGEPMQEVQPTAAPESADSHHPPGQRILTYRCFCGFCFDEQPDQGTPL